MDQSHRPGAAQLPRLLALLRTLLRALLSALLIGGTGAAWGAEPEVVSLAEGFGSMPVSQASVVLRDATSQRQLSDVLGLPEQFAPATLDFGGTAATYWVRLRLRGNDLTATTYWLDVNNRYLPEVEIFTRSPHGQYDSQLASAGEPFGARPLPYANFVFPLTVQPGQILEVMVRAKTLGIIRHSLDLKLWEPAAYKTYVRRAEVQWFFFLGLSVGLGLFNLFLYLSMRDTNYLLYVGTIIAQIWRTSDNGIAFEYFWPNAPLFEQVLSRGLSIIAVLLLGHFFVCRFIDLPSTRPRLFNWLTVACVVVSGLMLVTMSGGVLGDVLPLATFHMSQRLFVVIVVGYCLVLLGVLASWSWAGNRRARALLIAFFPWLILAGVILPVFAVLKIDINWTVPPTMLGSGIAMILMSLALADRMKEAQADKERAQEELVSGLIAKERELESRVTQRTHDLSQANQAFNAVLENARDAIVLTDMRGRITHWNRQAELCFSWERGETIGQAIAEVIFPDRQRGMIAALMARLRRGEDELPRLETEAMTKEGTEFAVELTLTSIKVGGETEFSFFLRDITQRRQAEMEIAESLARQRELAELRARFVTMASHELRTPLASILSSSELLSGYGERMSPKDKLNLFATIDRSVRRMTTMLEDVLLMGKSDAGAAQFVPGPCVVRTLCETVIAELGDALPEDVRRAHPFDLQVNPDVGTVYLDERWFRHIFTNLLSNAVKYSPAGGIVRLEVIPSAQGLSFQVSDQGIGLAQEDIPRVFEAFFRAGNIGTIEGTGLGLAIVKRAVELHGGSISMASTLGKGSTVTVVLPVRQA